MYYRKRKNNEQVKVEESVPLLVDLDRANNLTLRMLLAQAVHQKGDQLNAHAIQILNCLAGSALIDLETLRKLAFVGVCDEIDGLRPVLWRVLLNQWPADTSKWEEI